MIAFKNMHDDFVWKSFRRVLVLVTAGNDEAALIVLRNRQKNTSASRHVFAYCAFSLKVEL